jgi:Predicted nucleotide kinase
MSKMGAIRRVFPGGNTSYGFKSYYEYIMPVEDARRIFVIKGGPGVGKSTFMKKIADDMLERGFDIEYHHCSSDNNSVDGIVIPQLKIALIDGTAPHVLDPRCPGAVDEIVNLGVCWDVEAMSAHKDKIIQANKDISRHYKTAYSLLSEARMAYNEWESYIYESLSRPLYNKAVREFINTVFQEVPGNYCVSHRPRHLFASAITPDGVKNYIDTLIKPDMNVYCLEGQPGSCVNEAIGYAAKYAVDIGLFTEQFHCPFEPQNLDMVLIPKINAALVNTTGPFHISPDKIDKSLVKGTVNFNDFLDQTLLNKYKSDIDDAKQRFYSLIEKAVGHISKSKAEHDNMETFYVSSMDFDKVQEIRKEILNRILRYAE